ncbi:restriction endonuclease subunit S [Nocardiopsis listeri]|uniref:restriction endonuclease subunit S n=1 Tax=Nocardiopsis listeri TaxID=53440 RepID=UPI000A00BE8A|nr:restriction endonuclease subunit S [Nocardiopsis listeri]
MSDSLKYVPFSELAHVNPGTQLPARGECTFLSMSDVTDDGKVSSSQVRDVRGSGGYTPFRDQDILFAKITPCMENGKGALVENLVSGCGFGSTEFHVLRAGGLSDSRFIAQWAQSRLLRQKAEAFMVGSAGQRRVPSAFFSHFNVPFLSLAEQRRIADLLDAMDESIGASSDCLKKLSLAKDGLVSYLFFDVLDGRRGPLIGVADVASGVTLGGSIVGVGGKFPCITVANVQDGHLDLNEVKEIFLPASAAARYTLRPGDFLMTEGGDFDKLGRGTVWRGEIEDCLYQNHIFRIRCDQSRMLPEFLSIYSASWYGKNYFRLASKQSTNLASINSTQVKSFPVPLVSLEEQRRIVSIVQAHDERIAAEKARLEKLRKLKAGLMDDLLTGRVRVNQLDELPV